MGYQKMYYPKWDYKCGKYEADDCEYDYKHVDKCCGEKDEMDYPV